MLCNIQTLEMAILMHQSQRWPSFTQCAISEEPNDLLPNFCIINFFNLRKFPTLVKEGSSRPIEAEVREPGAARHRLDPVVLPALGPIAGLDPRRVVLQNCLASGARIVGSALFSAAKSEIAGLRMIRCVVINRANLLPLVLAAVIVGRSLFNRLPATANRT